MKNLKKRLRRRSVEAYTCACHTPDDCLIVCGPDFTVMQNGIRMYAAEMGDNKM